MKFLTTVTGSYPRKDIQKDTLRKSSVSDEEALEMIKWAVKEQSDLGLDIITDGEGYRENMYWFYQLRTDGVDAENKKYKHFSTGGSMEKVDLSKTHGTKGFGIECAVIKDEIKNLDTKLATKWKMARKNTPEHIQVKQTITGPHMLARFSVNERTDLYPDDQALAMAYADVIIEELKKVCNEGCDYIQFDEPVWTENVNETDWGADVLNYIIEKFPNVKFNLHICGGNAHRKRGFFGRYTDMIASFKKLKINEIHLEHCSLHYPMLDIFKEWDFNGALSAGVVDQRIDTTETFDDIHENTKPILNYFNSDKILLTSECGLGHVPIDIAKAKIVRLVEAANKLRKIY
jgi:5-methyltetrahydropteroyltriglutamate--homocysteine methyltransferase